MNTEQLIKKLKKFQKDYPDLREQNISVWIDIKGSDQSICSEIKSISYCGSVDGNRPILKVKNISWDDIS